jgi:uncharacterized membrane protein
MRASQAAARWLFALILVAAGVVHFVRPDFYVRIMPPYFPWHRELVLLSGAVEIALGVLLVIPRTSRSAAWAVLALMVVFLTVHIHMSLYPEGHPLFSPAVIHARLAFQAVFIAWAYWLTRP